MNNVFFDWKTTNALEKIESVENTERLFIATAFMEQSGVDWIKRLADMWGLQKEKIKIFLSVDFSLNQPSSLLHQLDQLALVYIVSKERLHAKAVLAVDKNGTGKVMSGSANLTHNGMNNNLELSSVLDVTKGNTNIHFFFSKLEDLSVSVDSYIIESYRLREEELERIPIANDTMNTLFKSVFIPTNNAELPSAALLKDYYFTYDDYETLLEENAPLVTNELRHRRKAIRDKLIHLHDELESAANNMGLHSHWDDNHKVSHIEPSQFNYGRVNWMAVRFGKHRSQLDKLLPERFYGERELYSFPKHGCIQMSLNQHGFSVGLFHAVRHDSWDRAYVKDRIEKDPIFVKTMIKHLKNLEGNGYTWYIHDPVSGKEYVFDIDSDSMGSFPNFYANDQAGFESYVITTYDHLDEDIKTVNDIIDTIEYHFSLLKPLYDYMVQVP
ncbi:HKD family nuclease [Paenibacillus sp. LBL]|uniref:restriction endonuclease PLD domain-containing protein n=1 Tax=Paenibacillus sp. LBL TaxID=2940563 RepID=UPI002474EC02|nr:restriction endonuclease PLD domain-containing protein [Paenibacillus sp. LBL]MDH6670121.1 HKD family nuclease [Paenibacillus sp. LBL]